MYTYSKYTSTVTLNLGNQEQTLFKRSVAGFGRVLTSDKVRKLKVKVVLQ